MALPLQAILDDCNLTINRYEPVHGGDINRCYCLHTGKTKYFLKVNDATLYPGMFEKEANGLGALRKVLSTFESLATLCAPQVIKCGSIQGEQYLLLEWIEKGSPKPGFWKKFGNGLALMHQKQQSFFGWVEDNYIGSLPQHNTKHNSWHLFYTEYRVMPLVERLFNAGIFTKEDLAMANFFCKQTADLFPKEPPSLLHGDLWSGNYMITSTGHAVIFDPAVYYGHREMDIGMTQLFGGFDQQFYAAYQEVYPLEKGWKQRLPLTQLYPLLVHAVLFGGHYITRAKDSMRLF